MMIKPVTLTFRVSEDGRPLDIAREGERAPSIDDQDAATLYSNIDLEPSLAVSAFPVGASQQTCRITYAAVITPIRRASPSQIIDAMLSPMGYLLREAGPARLTRNGDDCTLPALRPRLIYYPAFDELALTPGRLGKLLLRFDVDAAGVPKNVTPDYSSMEPVAQVAATRAIEQSRFSSRARSGCLSWTTSATDQPVKAPPPPPALNYRLKTATCPPVSIGLLHVGSVPFPAAFQRRNVEGWAIVRFDIAPWGAVGNATAVAAEPAALFGEQAEKVVLAAAAEKNARGYSGCVTRVVFRLDDTLPAGTFIKSR